MTSPDEIQAFLTTWDNESRKTVALMKSLPADKYDFRPDPEGRSIGEMAWHLAEGDAYMTLAAVQGKFDFSSKPPGIERPKTVAELAPGFERIHAEAMERIRKLTPADWDRKITFPNGNEMTISHMLWEVVLYHGIHHRGQLGMMSRMAGGKCPSIYGPNHEETVAMKEKMAQAAKA
jgi:uncharacterized damage-inducible protein DinB